ncbi:MAG: hypothetical protein KatS3mg119_2115 [Rhodothalassiaceae bacterium]|nr:MAG: hypothetical protein KatS3mg119_2115 [Rhodothalassiaceae bacterium]
MVSSHQWGGNWTIIKLETLERYLQAYTTALRNRFFLAYIDAFAGSGRVPLKKKSPACPSEIDGSAIRALKLRHPFETYIFIDADRRKLDALQRRINRDYSKRNVIYLHGDANSILQNLRADQRFWSPKRRAVIFLDPFALNVEWKTLEAIAATEKVDLWYLFSIGAVLRLLPRQGLPGDPKWHEKLTKILGTKDWQQAFYEPPAQPSLPFQSDEEERVREKGAQAILNFVLERMKNLFPYVHEEPALLRDTGNRLLFALFFSMANPSENAKNLALNFIKDMFTDKDHDCPCAKSEAQNAKGNNGERPDLPLFGKGMK